MYTHTQVEIGGTTFTGVRGSFEYVTPAPPVVTLSVLEQYYTLFIALGSAIGLFLLLTVCVVCVFACMRRSKKQNGGRKGKKDDEMTIPLHPIRKVYTPPNLN